MASSQSVSPPQSTKSHSTSDLKEEQLYFPLESESKHQELGDSNPNIVCLTNLNLTTLINGIFFSLRPTSLQET